MGATSTIGANVQRQTYLAPLQRIINDMLWLEKFMIDPKKDFGYDGASSFMIPIKNKMNETIFTNLDGSTEPATVGAGNYVQAYDYLRTIVAPVSITQKLKQLFSDPKTNAAAINFIKEEMESAVTMLGLDMEHSFFAGGATGALGVVASANNTSKVVTLANNRGFRPGMRLDGFTGTSTKTADSVTVVAVSDAGLTITCDTGDDLSSLVSGDILYKEDLHASAGAIAAVFPNSLGDMIKNSGSIHNIALATNAWYSAHVVSGASPGTAEALTIKKLQNAIGRPRNVAGKPIPPVAVCHDDVYEAIAERFRTENVPIELMPAKDGMPAGLAFQYLDSVVKFFSVPKAMKNTIFFFDPAKMVRYHNGKDDFLKWGDPSKGGGYKMVRYAGMEERMYYAIFRQYATLDPRCTVRLDDMKGLSEE